MPEVENTNYRPHICHCGSLSLSFCVGGSVFHMYSTHLYPHDVFGRWHCKYKAIRAERQ